MLLLCKNTSSGQVPLPRLSPSAKNFGDRRKINVKLHTKPPYPHPTVYCLAMFSKFLSRSSARKVTAATQQVRTFAASFDGYGQHVFRGAVAAPYLEKAGLPANTLDSNEWTSNGQADKVAAAVLEWAKDNGASVYCHWFQPLGSSAFRHGMSGQVQNTMLEFNSAGKPVWDFKGKNILKGETDGSSYPNGGLRATHSAGAYLSVDPTSPIFLRGDTIFIPASMVSYYGHALDEKVRRPVAWIHPFAPPHASKFTHLCHSDTVPVTARNLASLSLPLLRRPPCCARPTPCPSRARVCSTCWATRASRACPRTSASSR